MPDPSPDADGPVPLAPDAAPRPASAPPTRAIRVEQVARGPDCWRARPDGAPTVAFHGSTPAEAIGKLVFNYQQYYRIEILDRHAPAGTEPVR